ncbi:SCO family protein [Allosphingosinicella flava]|nr:SCO family protein [Sphingosinicella flava]
MRTSLLILLGFFAFLGACSAPAEAPPLAGAAIGGPFALTDQDGKAVTDKDFDGAYRIVYFGYTYCPDVCPVDLQHIAQGYAAFEKAAPAKAAKVRPIFVSVDPERDTPAVVKQYVAAFHPRMTGLTGTPEQLAAAAKAYGVYYQRRDEAGASEYLMDHSRSAVLFGPKGEPIALLPQDQGAAAVAAELERWVR